MKEPKIQQSKCLKEFGRMETEEIFKYVVWKL